MILFTPNEPHQLENDIRGIIDRQASDAFQNAFIFRNENHATHDGDYSLDDNTYLVVNVGEHDVELFESFLTQHPFTHVDVYLPTDDQSEHIHVFATRPDGTRVLHGTLSAENFEYAHTAIDLPEPLSLSDIDEQDRYLFTSTLVSLLGEGAELWCVTTSSDATLYDNDREAKADVPYNEVRSTKIEHFAMDEAGVVQYKRLYVRQVRDLVFTDEPE